MPNVSTPQPPVKQPPPPNTAGNMPPVQVPQAPSTGGNMPPGTVPGQLPPIVGQNYVAQPTGGTGFQNYTSPGATAGLQGYAQQGQYGTVQDPSLAGRVVQGNLDSLLSSDGKYMENARLRGLEQAANSGLRNSSIAAGASQRAAIESSMPILSEIQNLNNMREQNIFAGTEASLNRGLEHQMQQNQLGFTGQQNQFDRQLQDNQQKNQLQFQAGQNQLDRTQGVNNQILNAQLEQNRAMQDFQFKDYLMKGQAQVEDWLSNQNYSRQINASIAQTQLNTVAQLSQLINQYAVDNPEVYPPNIVSGLQNFLSGSFLSLMQQYFPNSVGGGG